MCFYNRWAGIFQENIEKYVIQLGLYMKYTTKQTKTDFVFRLNIKMRINVF